MSDPLLVQGSDNGAEGRERMETVASLSILDDDGNDDEEEAADGDGNDTLPSRTPQGGSSIRKLKSFQKDEEEMCCGRPEKRLRVLILIIATAALVFSALAAALGIALTAPSCASGFCPAYGRNFTVMHSMPGQAPSFLRFSQTAHEKSTCVAPRAFVVGGEFTSGWAQRWNLVTTEGAAHLFDGFSVLVSNTSGKLNWPHSVAQDACTGSLYIANANDNVIDELACSQPVVGDNFQVACNAYTTVFNATNVFTNPLGLHEVIQSGSSSSSDECSGTSEKSNGMLIVTGGTEPQDSYVGKLTRQSERQYLVDPARGLLNKVYSPTIRQNGSILAADAFNNRIVQINCVDVAGSSVSCLSNTAVSGDVATVLETYYPRAVVTAVNTDGTEVAFIGGGDVLSNATYVKKINLGSGKVTTVLPGGILDRPHCVAIDPESLDLLVCDKGNGRVLRLPCLLS
eukprot:INCI2655.1.p1 GENE.INCI2655.1~~INCI2655.1.p1  ORF type:complete len:457 (-),score=80.91 INCI2655.1:1660-3030(-)